MSNTKMGSLRAALLSAMCALGALSTPISPAYVGINNGDHETDAFSLTDRKSGFCYVYASMSIRVKHHHLASDMCRYDP